MHIPHSQRWFIGGVFGLISTLYAQTGSAQLQFPACDSAIVHQILTGTRMDTVPSPRIVLVMHNWIMSCPVYGMQVQQEIAYGLRARWQMRDSVFVYFWESPPSSTAITTDSLAHRFIELMEQADFPPGSVRCWQVLPQSP